MYLVYSFSFSRLHHMSRIMMTNMINYVALRLRQTYLQELEIHFYK